MALQASNLRLRNVAYSIAVQMRYRNSSGVAVDCGRHVFGGGPQAAIFFEGSSALWDHYYLRDIELRACDLDLGHILGSASKEYGRDAGIM